MSSLNETSRGMRIAIAFLGRRNAGKSSVLNSLVGYDLAIVSDIAGTTTDPVNKAVEINPLGPCLVIDTAGIDDSGDLGQKRIEKTKTVIQDCDVGLIVIGDGQWTFYEEEILDALKAMNKPLIVVLNQADQIDYRELESQLQARQLDYIKTIATVQTGTDRLKDKIRALKNVSGLEDPSIIGDLINSGDLLLLIVPLDLGAPKGRLILPQVQTIRDILDNDGIAMMVKEDQLAGTLENLTREPRLVITDSQVVKEVAADLPEHIPLTTFSTIFARYKGDLRQLVEGVGTIDNLQNGDRILIAEACTHHPSADDIGRVKIPRWISEYSNKILQFELAAGPAFPSDIDKYRLIIQCGGCTISRTAYRNRQKTAAESGIPMTNYGIAISYVQGVLPRIIRPFPEMQGLF